MTHITNIGMSSSDNHGPRPSRPFFVTDLIRRYGFRGVMAIFVAAIFAFAPLGVLYWVAALRLQPVINNAVARNVVVKPASRHDEQEREEPGETALLQIRCDVQTVDGWEELLLDGDPARPSSPLGGLRYVRHEQVYLRKAGSSYVPFGLLGPPPVSVWVPAGDYEVLVVYEAPSSETKIYLPGRSYPWLSEFAQCSAEAKQKTVCRVALPHHDLGNPDRLLNTGNPSEASDRGPTIDELAPLLIDYEIEPAIPTPAGFLLNLREPTVWHQDGHRGCAQNFDELLTMRREWTRDQLVTLRNWLPAGSTAARAQLTALVDRLDWRQFLQGWFCFALAGVSGWMFTRWGAIALLEPWQHRHARHSTFGLLVKIFLLSAGIWFLAQILSGTSGPLSFRFR